MLIQNKRLDKLDNLTTIDNNLNGIQKKMVEYENTLNQLEEEKEQLRDKMDQKTNQIRLSSKLTDKTNTSEEKIFLFME